MTGETKIYVDGNKERDSVLSEGLTTSAEGRLRIGGKAPYNFEGKISGLNVWNRILTDEEIRKMSKDCSVSAESWKDWYDIKSELTEGKFKLSDSSECKAAAAV